MGNRARVKIRDDDGAIVHRPGGQALNARRHGLNATAKYLAPHDRDELENLITLAVEQYEPVGIMERTKLELICFHVQRQLRAARLELFQIHRNAKGLAAHHANPPVNEEEFCRDEVHDPRPTPAECEIIASLPSPDLQQAIMNAENHSSKAEGRLWEQFHALQRRRKRRSTPRRKSINVKIDLAAQVSAKNRRTDLPMIEGVQVLPGPAAHIDGQPEQCKD